MTMLEINGKRVKVDDSFMSLSPEQQNATVEEIASQMGDGQSAPDPMAELSGMSQGMNAPKDDVDRRVRANMEATKLLGGRSHIGMAAAPRLPFSDEIGAAMMTPVRMFRDQVGPGEAYGRQVALNRELQSRNREANPIASTVGEIAGGVPLGGIASRIAPASTGIGRAVTEGAAFGALYGADEANGKNIGAEAAKGAAIGAATGGLIGGVGNVAGRALTRRAQGAAPTVDDLAQQGSALYDRATQAGVTLKPGAMKRVQYNTAAKLKSFGFDADLQPKTAIVMKRIASASDDGMTLTELENLRKMATTVTREAADASDKKAAGLIVEEIDRLIDSAGNFRAGSNEALSALKDARGVWKRKLKVDVLNDINERAMNQATGYENGLVIQLRSLANNKKRLGMFSAEEQKMIKDAVRRGTGRAALRAIGMLSPTSTFGGLMTGGVGVGSGILPAAAMAGVGMGSRKAAEAMTRNQFTTLQDAVARGFTPTANPQIQQNLRRFIPAATAGTTEIPQ